MPFYRRISNSKQWRILLLLAFLIILACVLACELKLLANFETATDSTDCVDACRKLAQESKEWVSEDINTKDNGCDKKTFHIAVVCGGHSSALGFASLLKGIILHRRNVISLHIVSDPTAQEIVETLLSSWNIPDLSLTFYDAGAWTSSVSWIPNKHYSGIYGLLKLLIPSIVPVSVSSVLVLDTDLLAFTDVSKIFSYFELNKGSSVLGFVENQSNWTLMNKQPQGLGGVKKPWPAIGRGFNSGVIMMDLGGLRSANWMKLWQQVAKQLLPIHLSTDLADQDIFNAVLKTYPDLAIQLPCYFNVQFSDASLWRDLCPHAIGSLRSGTILHWNSPEKFEFEPSTEDSAVIRYITQEVSQIDGYALRYRGSVCDEGISVSEKHRITTTVPPVALSEVPDSLEDLNCRSFVVQSDLDYRVHIYLLPFEPSSLPHDVTLVTQLTFDRIYMLQSVFSRWLGPASVSIYLTDTDLPVLLDFLKRNPDLSSRTNIAYHAVFKLGTLYPVNFLRNIALQHVRTAYTYIHDIDFIPCESLHERLREKLFATGIFWSSGNNKRAVPIALVIPSFQLKTVDWRADAYGVPKDKLQLLEYIRNGSMTAFNADVWHEGHKATNYSKWLTAVEAFEAKWDIDYEPYVVLKSPAPLFDVRFSGFGWNKVEYVMELHYSGHRFMVCPDLFTVHVPHPPSLDSVRYRTRPEYRQCVRLFKAAFMKKLAKTYGLSGASV